MSDSPIPVEFISEDQVPFGVLGNVIRGPAGANFQPSATGPFSARSTYDSQPQGFAFLATDTGVLYFREGLTAGGWSSGVQFAASAAYVHDQVSPSATWIINHNLGFRPSVELFDAGSQEFDGEISHPTVNQVVVSLTTAVSGFARLL